MQIKSQPALIVFWCVCSNFWFAIDNFSFALLSLVITVNDLKGISGNLTIWFQLFDVQFDSESILNSQQILDWMNRKGGRIYCVPNYSLCLWLSQCCTVIAVEFRFFRFVSITLLTHISKMYFSKYIFFLHLWIDAAMHLRINSLCCSSICPISCQSYLSRNSGKWQQNSD